MSSHVTFVRLEWARDSEASRVIEWGLDIASRQDDYAGDGLHIRLTPSEDDVLMDDAVLYSITIREA